MPESLNKVTAASACYLHVKTDTEFCEISKTTFSYRTSPVDGFASSLERKHWPEMVNLFYVF